MAPLLPRFGSPLAESVARLASDNAADIGDRAITCSRGHRLAEDARFVRQVFECRFDAFAVAWTTQPASRARPHRRFYALHLRVFGLARPVDGSAREPDPRGIGRADRVFARIAHGLFLMYRTGLLAQLPPW